MDREIVKLHLTRVDLTDIGENLDLESGEGSHVILAKRATPGVKHMTAPTIEDLTKQVEDLTAKLAANETTAEAVSKRATEAEAKVKELTDAAAPPAPEDDFSKLPEPIRKRMEAIEKRAIDAEAKADAERDSRLESEWIAKSATYTLPGLVASEFGPIMKRAAIMLPKDDVAKLEVILKSATEVVRQSGLMVEQGANGSGEKGTATEEIRKRATALAVEKSIPYERAYVTIAESDPALVQKSRDEAYATA